MATSPASFVEEVPEYEIRNGHMHINMGCCVIVMPLAVFRQGMARASEALALWQIERIDCVVHMPFRAEH